MKLLRQNIIVNAAASLVVIFLGGLITWYFLVGKIRQESEEHLRAEQRAVLEMLEEGQDPENFSNNIGDEIRIKEIPSSQQIRPHFKSVIQKEAFESSHEQEEEEEEEEGAFQAMSIVFGYQAPQKNYEITIIRSADNDEELDKNILITVSISAILVVLLLVLANYFIYKKLWDPFYSVLKQVQNFNISTNDVMLFPATGIREFQDLNRALEKMEKKIIYDYRALKEFTENASHEIQTPLAVISSKIEMCLQEPNLSQQQVKLLVEASHAVNTLSNLNKGLLILTKLDNNQFDGPELIHMDAFVRDRLQLFDDFIKAKEIQVSVSVDPSFTIRMNPLLAETLFDNLLKNAIKHNYTGGSLRIECIGNIVRVANTGAEPRYETEKMFERFFKDSREGSLGLGLALVKKICDIQGYAVSYEYINGEHLITLKPGIQMISR